MAYYDELIAHAFDRRAALAATYYAWGKDAERTARHYARTVGISVAEARVSLYRAISGRPMIGVDRMDEGTLKTRLEILEPQEEPCHHQWETGADGFGVVYGVSRCKLCGVMATKREHACEMGIVPCPQCAEERK